MRTGKELVVAVVVSVILGLVSGCGGGGGHQQVADLSVMSSHAGSFMQGQTGATYTITVSNTGNGPTTATVTVVDGLPSGLTATDLSGPGWTCTLNRLNCTRNDTLNASSSYPAITLSVDVALAAAPANLTNTVTVSGGGEQNTANDTASDLTTLTCAPGLPSLCGQFVILAEGYDQNGAYKMLGSITGDGFGNVTSGLFDEVRVGSSNGAVAIQSGSNYNVGPDGRGTMNLVTPLGDKTFKLSFSTDLHGNAIESDPATGTHAAVFVGAQSGNFNAADISGDYALGLVGENSNGGRVGMLAVLSGDGNCGLSSKGNTVTINDGGTVSIASSFTGTCNGPSGSTIDPATGRGLASLAFTGGAFNGSTLNFVFYMIGGLHTIVFIEKDAPTSTIPSLSGLVRPQRNPGLNCGSTSPGQICILSEWGRTSGGDSDVSLARAVQQPNGNLTITLDQNQGGAITSNQTTAGFPVNLTPVSTGTITPPPGVSVSPIDFVLFQLDSAFLLSRDSSVSFGSLIGQSVTDFPPTPPRLIAGFNALLNGPPPTAQVSEVSGVVTPSAATSGSFAGTWDAATGAGFTSSAASGSYTIDPTTGRGSGTLSVPGDPTSTNPGVVFYVFDGNPDFFLMENDAGNTAARLWLIQR